MNNKLIVIGKIASTFGFKGWMHMHSESEPKNSIFSYNKLYIIKNKNEELLDIEEYKEHGNHFIIKTRGIDVKEDASPLKNKYIYIYRSQLKKIDDNSYYYADLEGMKVVCTEGSYIGNVYGIIDNNGNTLLQVINSDNKEILIPIHLNIFIKNIDLQNKVITVYKEMIIV